MRLSKSKSEMVCHGIGKDIDQDFDIDIDIEIDLDIDIDSDIDIDKDIDFENDLDEDIGEDGAAFTGDILPPDVTMRFETTHSPKTHSTNRPAGGRSHQLRQWLFWANVCEFCGGAC